MVDELQWLGARLPCHRRRAPSHCNASATSH